MVIPLTEERREEIANFMKDNPDMTYEQYTKILNCSRPQILKIRKKYKFEKKRANELSKELEKEIKNYMISYPQKTYREVCLNFNCNMNQVNGIRKKYKLKKFTRPSSIKDADKDIILDYMKNNLTVGYDEMSELFGYSKTQIRWLRMQSDLKSVNSARREKSRIIIKRMKIPNSNTLEDFLLFKLNQCKFRLKLNVEDENTLTYDDLLHQYNRQDAKCYYTGRIMDLRINSINSLSIDRIDSSKNYSKNNIVLCCSVVNFMKKKSNIQDFIDACIDVAKNHTS